MCTIHITNVYTNIPKKIQTIYLTYIQRYHRYQRYIKIYPRSTRYTQNAKRRRGRSARPGPGAGPGPPLGAGAGACGAAPPPLGILYILVHLYIHWIYLDIFSVFLLYVDTFQNRLFRKFLGRFSS